MRVAILPLAALTLFSLSSLVCDARADELDFELEEEDLEWEIDVKTGSADPELELEEDLDEELEFFEDEFGSFDEDDDPMVSLDLSASQAPTAATVAPATLRLEVLGMEPLADNYPARIVATERDAVVVELPVLLGRSRASFEGPGYWLRAEVLVEGQVTTSSSQWVVPEGLAEYGPSFAFFKLLTPVNASAGQLEIRVSRVDTMGQAPTRLFSRELGFSLF